MRGLWACALGLACGCGRVNFDPASDARALGSADARPADQIADLVVWYPLDDAAFSGRAVEVVRGLDATCMTGLCPTPTAGRVGGGALLDGVTFFRIPYDPALDTPSGLTIAAWFRADMYTTYNTVVSRPVGPAGTNTWQLDLPDTLVARFKLADSPTSEDDYRGPVTLGAWLHVAGTWDGATAQMYEDGVVVGAGAHPVVPFDPNDCFIGADLNAGSPGSYFRGLIDDVRLYSRALSGPEIALLATP